MEIKLHQLPGLTLAEIIADQVLIHSAQDALEILANCWYQGASAVLLQQHQLPPAFFDLKTGMAGEVLQKCSNYRMQMGITGDFEPLVQNSKSLRDFIYESNKTGKVVFAASIQEAMQLLVKK